MGFHVALYIESIGSEGDGGGECLRLGLGEQAPDPGSKRTRLHAMDDLAPTMRSNGARLLIPRWDAPLIAASIAISLLGAFTSTQLMCQARTSRFFSGVLVWTILGSLTFGFCSIWSLHEVAMLAYGLDIRIGINVGLTVLSAMLAVSFTFVALSSDMLYDRYRRNHRAGKSKPKRKRKESTPRLSATDDESSEPLLQQLQQATGMGSMHTPDQERAGTSYFSKSQQRPSIAVIQDSSAGTGHMNGGSPIPEQRINSDTAQPSDTHSFRNTILAEAPTDQIIQRTDSQDLSSSDLDREGVIDSERYQDTQSYSPSSWRSSSFGMSSASAMGLGGFLSMKRYRRDPDISANPFVAFYEALLAGLNVRNVAKGFFWAIAITSMHYVGIRGLEVPQGFVSLNPYLVLLSGVICWVVCVVGCILIGEIETHLGQQLLFSAVATCGVAAMRTYN